jgi:hypothetical protein
MAQPKPGDRFSFSYLDEKGTQPHEAIVQRILSNRQEGLAPEIDWYAADWLEALPADPAAPAKSFTIMLGTNNTTYIEGRAVSVNFQL